MQKTKHITIIFLLLCGLNAKAQHNVIMEALDKLVYLFGGSGNETVNDIQRTSDGGYIMAGSSTSSASGDVLATNHGTTRDLWLVKFNADGTKAWDKLYGGSGDDGASFIQETSDGYIITGYSFSSDGDIAPHTNQGAQDLWVLKIGTAGNIQWQKSFGTAYSDIGDSVREVSDGYVVAGFNGDPGSIWLMKFDFNGILLWQKLYDNNSVYKSANSMVLSGDGGMIMVGEYKSALLASRDLYISKFNSAGNRVWEKIYAGSGVDLGISIQRTSDGNFIVVGLTDSPISGDVTIAPKGGNDAWILKLDPSGNILWQKRYGGSGVDNVRRVEQTLDGGYILTGRSQSSANGDITGTNNGVYDYWILKLDASGNKVWDKLYGGSGIDSSYVVLQNTDGTYIIAGDSWDASAGSGNQSHLSSQGGQDLWILNLDANGDIIY